MYVGVYVCTYVCKCKIVVCIYVYIYDWVYAIYIYLTMLWNQIEKILTRLLEGLHIPKTYIT